MRFLFIALASFFLSFFAFVDEGKCGDLNNASSHVRKEYIGVNTPQLNDAQIFEREMLKRKQLMQGRKKTKRGSGKIHSGNQTASSSKKTSGSTRKSAGRNVECGIPSLASGMFVK